MFGYNTWHMRDIRRTAIWAVCGVVLAVVLVVGGVKLFGANDPYTGLTLWRETQIPEETRIILEQRIATTNASIAAKLSAGEDVSNDLYESLAYDAYVLGDLVTARESYERVVNANPLYYIGWNAYANTLEAMGDYDDAERAYRQALSLAPDVDTYYTDLTDLLTTRFTGRDEEVLALLQQGVDMLGQRLTFMIALAEWYTTHGDCDRAIAHYKVVASLNPAVAESVNVKIADIRATCSE